MTNTKPKHRHRARRLVLQGLYQWEISGNDISEIETNLLLENTQRVFDQDYFHECLHGIPSQASELDELLTAYTDRDLQEVTPVELAILRMGAYELKHRIDVPYKVVLNEAVELCKVFGANESHKFINGILDKLAQQVRKEEL